MFDIEVFEGGFKETELGPLPEEWEVVRLGEVVKIIKGKKPKSLSKNPSKNSLPYLTAEYFRYGVPKQFVDIEVEKDLPICKKEDVVLIWDGSKAGQVFTGLEGVLASTMVKIIPTINNLDKLYLYCFLATKFDYLNSQTTGSTIPHVNKTAFFNLPLPLPPLEEQKAIAGILSTVQSAIEKTEKVINALKNLKKSMMKHLFTYGPVAEEEAEKVELKETEIGLIPKHWEVVRLGEVVEKMKAGGTPRRSEKRFWGGSIPFIMIEDLTKSNLYIKDAREYITEEGLEKSNAWIVPPNSLLLSMYATIGETAINLIPVATNQAILGIIPKKHRLNVEFGAYLLKFHAKRLLFQNIQTTQKNINKGIVENFLIPLPPLEEQQKIAQILQSIDQRIEKEEKYKNALQNLFKSLLHNLMTGKIRVRVKSHGED
jgi:type I restriction enzyme S subunit